MRVEGWNLAPASRGPPGCATSAATGYGELGCVTHRPPVLENERKKGSTSQPNGWTIDVLPIVRRLVMCYSWHEDVDKTVQKDIGQEDPRKTVPEGYPENRIPPEQSRFWTFPIGRRGRTTEEVTADRTLEKV
jgi:hypothetical protein